MSELLSSINGPADLRALSVSQLRRLAIEVRELIIEVVARNGGHLSSNLGVVELTIALHYSFDFLKDRLVWDVGHQSYAHKILTGRRDRFATLRQKGGVSGFADKDESPYDTFSFGHTGTSVSAGLGLALARKAAGEEGRVVAVIGDGAIASGMPLEALNHAGDTDCDLLVILNDNEMSISPTVGGVARYLSRVRASTPYMDFKREAAELMSRWKSVLEGMDKVYGRLSEGVQAALTPGGLFVELGFHYYGPVDGHDIGELLDALEHMKRIRGPVLLHVLTRKGMGFEPAAADPAAFHSAGQFKVRNGKVCTGAAQDGDAEPARGELTAQAPSWSDALGGCLLRLAAEDRRLVAITAAMCHGTGLAPFARDFPGRFHDVGICEQHAVGLAGGLAAGVMRPAVCIYSAFLQRAYDQLCHDVALQGAPVLFCVDRAGLVGSDGPTHHGLHDISYFRCLPGFVVMAPADAVELERMLRLALAGDRPCAVRYPREKVPLRPCGGAKDFTVGQAEVLRAGKDAALIAYGALVPRALEAADILAADGRSVTVVNGRFAKPLDAETICRAVREHPVVVVAEDHAAGGFGAALLEALAEKGVAAGHVRLAAVPDQPIAHASREEQLAELRLDGPGLAARVREMLGN